MEGELQSLKQVKLVTRRLSASEVVSPSISQSCKHSANQSTNKLSVRNDCPIRSPVIQADDLVCGKRNLHVTSACVNALVKGFHGHPFCWKLTLYITKQKKHDCNENTPKIACCNTEEISCFPSSLEVHVAIPKRFHDCLLH